MTGFRYWTIVLAAYVLLSGCGPLPTCEESIGCDQTTDADTNTDTTCPTGYQHDGVECVRVVAYELECKTITCNGPDDVRDFETYNYQSFTCTWHCARFEGVPERYVALTFEVVDGCWVFGSRYTSSGLCN